MKPSKSTISDADIKSSSILKDKVFQSKSCTFPCTNFYLKNNKRKNSFNLPNLIQNRKHQSLNWPKSSSEVSVNKTKST